MPLTKKGTKIMGAMQSKYGQAKGEQVFYASRNKGRITGVDRTRRKKKLPKHGSGELTPLGQRVLSGYMSKWGDSDGHDKFEAACRKGLISKDKMFKNPEKAKV